MVYSSGATVADGPFAAVAGNGDLEEAERELLARVLARFCVAWDSRANAVSRVEDTRDTWEEPWGDTLVGAGSREAAGVIAALALPARSVSCLPRVAGPRAEASNLPATTAALPEALRAASARLPANGDA